MAGAPPVLVTWGESRMALAATRALGKAGVPVAVLAENSWAPASHSKYCVEKVQAPDSDAGSKYIERIDAVVSDKAYSGIVFCDDRSALYVGRERKRFEGKLPLLLPAQSALELTLNKVEMMKFADANGIAYPRSHMISHPDDLEAACRDLQFPLMVKGSGGFGSNSLRIVRDMTAAAKAYQDIQHEQSLGNFKEPPHVQEHILGDVFSVIALCQDGRVCTSFAMRKLQTFPSWGGVAVQAESVRNDALSAFAHDIVQKLNWTGIIEIECIQDTRSGRYLLIEVSPDPNWGLDLAIACGVNIPLEAWRMMQKQPLTVASNYKTGKKFAWYLAEGARLWMQHPPSRMPLLRSALNPFVSNNVSILDWKPTLQLAKRTYWTLLIDKENASNPAT